MNGSQVQIVRAVSTYVKNSIGVTDRSLMDITILRSLDYVRLACRARITQRSPREKLNDTRLQRIRSELLDVLYALEQLEIVGNVDAHKEQLTVTRSRQDDDSRADASIPATVVRGLRVFAATFIFYKGACMALGYTGAVLLEVNSTEVEVTEFSPRENTGRQLVKTMNSTGRAKGYIQEIAT
ncbi:MAG: phage tail sheath C-terminal domain-containing protein [Sodalis sp. (in: enterobacteria)]|uniref:phage tail sheath C-terminal domain-containing protein n=1 Tax=Sodalis sp. (in: enterobacteria) TaxID=1898979 RepID=UPI003F3FB307